MLERPARRKGIANLARKVTLSEIRIGKRYRREMGDIGGLAASMEELRLLQPIVVTPDGTLIAGERRLRAALQLGWTHISISVVDIDAIVRGEFAENAQRKGFTLSETVAIRRALEPIERAAAKQRQGMRRDRHPERRPRVLHYGPQNNCLNVRRRRSGSV
jgi:ParB/RepB/Spo0J family partition protein